MMATVCLGRLGNVSFLNDGNKRIWNLAVAYCVRFLWCVRFDVEAMTKQVGHCLIEGEAAEAAGGVCTHFP